MALISERIAAEHPEQHYASFEFFPPRSDKGEHDLVQVYVPLFVKQQPIFLDVTWGAGGSTSSKTMEICKQLQATYPDVPINMHITCTNMPKGLIHEALEFSKANNIRNIVALRGDPPAGQEFRANEDGFSCALDLVKYIRATYGDFFCISVSGYPEGHPSKLEADSTITDENYASELAYLKEKVDAGADLIITQLFYDVTLFINFVKRCRSAGIKCPILPGMLPITNYKSLQRMVDLCKTYIPASLKEEIEALVEKPDELKALGVRQCADMIREIIAADIGINHFHFYTINSPDQTIRVMKEVGLYKEQ